MKKYFQLLVIAVLLASCSKSDDSDITPDQQTPDQSSLLLGVWTIEQVEIKSRCDNDALLDEGFDPDVVDNIGDLEFTADGIYHFLDDNGDVTDVEDMNGQYEINGDIITFFYTVNGSPRSSTDRVNFTEEGDLELQGVDYCETHADLGIYYADRYIRVQ